MSAVTKTFIVLLVICSLLLVAANVVFVNRVEDYRKLAAEKDVRMKQSEASAASANAAAMSKDSWVNAITLQHQDEIKRLAVTRDALADQIKSKDSQIANALKQAEDFKTQHATVASIAEAVGKQNTVLEEQLKNVRTELATLLTNKTQIEIELTRRIKEVLNLNEQLKVVLEENTELKDQIAKNAKMVSVEGTGPKAIAGVPFAGNINGAVTKVQPWRDMVIATINVGSVDRVAPGMKFHVVNNGNYLGTLTIIGNPDPNEAFGRIEGPRANDVKEGMQVRTQLNAG